MVLKGQHLRRPWLLLRSYKFAHEGLATVPGKAKRCRPRFFSKLTVLETVMQTVVLAMNVPPLVYRLFPHSIAWRERDGLLGEG